MVSDPQTTRPTVDVGVECYVPQVPNFLRTVACDVPIPIHGLSDKELRRVGRKWTEWLLQHAAIKRANLV